MIDLQDVRSRPDAYAKAAKAKNLKVDVKAFLTLDEERRTLLLEVEEMRARRNAVSKEVPNLKGEEKTKTIAEMKSLGDDLKTKEESLAGIEALWTDTQLRLPGIPLDRVPVGNDDSENVEIRKVGEIPAFDFELKDHVTLGEELDILDIPKYGIPYILFKLEEI